MKQDIHPKYDIIEATCVCGNTVKMGSTQKVMKVDICAACHPFFTGTQRIMDAEGRVERFNRKYGDKK
jgi:large subunit ribosomal protein L31